MKIGICSDLHMEFRKAEAAVSVLEKIQKTECDLLINAGDTHPNLSMRGYFSSQLREGKQFYFEVLGNHDFYGGQMIQDGIQIMVLPNGMKLLGCTFWTDFNSGDPAAEMAFRHQIVDNFQIKPGSVALVERMKEIHKANLDVISKEKPDIVVTHHAPSFLSVAEQYKAAGMINYSFVSNEDNFIRANPNIKYWFHGHTHNPVDYMIGDCRVIANQLGYPEEIYWCDSDYEVKVIEL
jgi:predicted phosphodiesterase